MDGPVFIPWDPRQLLPPGDPNPGIDGAIVGWEYLSAVFSQILPAALTDLINLLDL